MEQNRFLSPVVWGTVAAQILALLVTLGVINVGESSAIEAVVVAVLELLTAFGILNNPKDKSNF
jgi:ABC-type enterochelin transport system permease subunit